MDGRSRKMKGGRWKTKGDKKDAIQRKRKEREGGEAKEGEEKQEDQKDERGRTNEEDGQKTK